MIITRTPLRITLGGGGTDDPQYAREFGGFAITAAISRHIYVSVNRTFSDDYFVRYSETERVANPSDIAHPIVREALRYYNVRPGVEIVSMSDIPSGTGLGSSGVFTVGLCAALAAYVGSPISQSQAAIDATRIELEILGRSGGKQDHYACALGGLRWIKFARSGVVESAAIDAPDEYIAELQNGLRLYYTGCQRDANDVLSTQTTEGLDEIKHLGYKVHHMLVSGDIGGVGAIMNQHWQLKRQRSAEMSNQRIDTAYTTALNNGAIGGKLVGAGGGGFLLFLTESDRLTPAMAKIGMPKVPFTFDRDGVTLISN